MLRIFLFIIVIILAAISVSGCAATNYSYNEPTYTLVIQKGTVLENLTFDPVLENKVLNLNPERISAKDVEETLSHFPAPRIINLNGSIPIVSMESFSRFLIAMGYPEGRVRNPKNGSYSYNGFMKSRKLAGFVSWYYEREGMMPILIGHSQGGMAVIKTLHELAGSFREVLQVWNPLTGKTEKRTAIIDPLKGLERPVMGLQVEFAAAIATGKLMRIIWGQWNMVSKLRQIPDSTREFTGFFVRNDVIGSDSLLEGGDPYIAIGSAKVRNVTLPAGYKHIWLPLTEHLALKEETKIWITNYSPSTKDPQRDSGFEANHRNILLAAELWFNIKKYWCLQLQELIKAKRMQKQKKAL